MTIKDDMLSKIAARLMQKYVQRYIDDPAWAWQQARDAVQTTDAEGREEITKDLMDTKVIKDYLKGLAVAEAQALLADDTLNLDELNRVFG